MARKNASVEYNNFTNGFITEASPLTFPENASIDETNMNINRDGSRQRRFGLNWGDTVDNKSASQTLSGSGEATSSYLWKSAGNDGTNNIGVLQRGRSLFFYDVDDDNPANAYLATQTLTSGEMPSASTPLAYATAYGRLIVATNDTSVYTFKWVSGLPVKDSYSLKIRDLFGVDDGYVVDERRTADSNYHRYNLQNQGFPASMTCAGDKTGSIDTVQANPVTYARSSSVGLYPANSDLVWSLKLDTIDSASAFTDNVDAFSPWAMLKSIFGTTPAPKGKFIIDLFDRGTSRENEYLLAVLPNDETLGGITSVSSFAGRLWYSVSQTGLTGGDDNTPNLGNMILYSQATSDFARWKACHGVNDPTAEDFNDVLSSDGGFILIPESGEIYEMVPLGESMFIFTSNGVWEVFGGDVGFSASTQSVVKVTDIGALSKRPIMAGDNSISYWAESGIYSITLDKTSLRGIATNLTENTIQGYYDDIPIELKKQATGIYDPISRQAVWLYNLDAKDSEFYFDKELVLDVNKLTFTKRDFPSVNKTVGAVYPTTHFRLRNLLQGTQIEDVTDGGIVVTDSAIDVSVTLSDAEQQTKTSLMYWIADSTASTEDFRLGGYLNFDFYDYPQVQDTLGGLGVDAPAFLLTGYLTGGDSSRDKWLPYLSVKSKRTESSWSEDGEGIVTVVGESSCSMQVQWEWTNNALAGKWSTEAEVYRLPRFFTLDDSHEFSFDVVTTRNKVRGNGKALSVKFTSSPGKDMFLLGWGMEVEINSNV